MEAMHCLSCGNNFYSAAARQMVEEEYCECGGDMELGIKPLETVEALIEDIILRAGK